MLWSSRIWGLPELQLTGPSPALVWRGGCRHNEECRLLPGLRSRQCAPWPPPPRAAGVLLSETPGPEVVHFLLQTGELRGRSGEGEVCALIEVAVYAFLGDHAPHFPDGIEHRSVLGYRTLAIRVLGQFVKGSGEQV